MKLQITLLIYECYTTEKVREKCQGARAIIITYDQTGWLLFGRLLIPPNSSTKHPLQPIYRRTRLFPGTCSSIVWRNPWPSTFPSTCSYPVQPRTRKGSRIIRNVILYSFCSYTFTLSFLPFIPSILFLYLYSFIPSRTEYEGRSRKKE